MVCVTVLAFGGFYELGIYFIFIFLFFIFYFLFFIFYFFHFTTRYATKHYKMKMFY